MTVNWESRPGKGRAQTRISKCVNRTGPSGARGVPGNQTVVHQIVSKSGSLVPSHLCARLVAPPGSYLTARPFPQLSSRPESKGPRACMGHACYASHECVQQARRPGPVARRPDATAVVGPADVRTGRGVVTCPPAPRLLQFPTCGNKKNFTGARRVHACRYQMHCMHGPAVDPWTSRGESREGDGVGRKRLVALRLAESRGGGR